jgi:hypothetical protein
MGLSLPEARLLTPPPPMEMIDANTTVKPEDLAMTERHLHHDAEFQIQSDVQPDATLAHLAVLRAHSMTENGGDRAQRRHEILTAWSFATDIQQNAWMDAANWREWHDTMRRLVTHNNDQLGEGMLPFYEAADTALVEMEESPVTYPDAPRPQQAPATKPVDFSLVDVVTSLPYEMPNNPENELDDIIGSGEEFAAIRNRLPERDQAKLDNIFRAVIDRVDATTQRSYDSGEIQAVGEPARPEAVWTL